MTKMGLFIEVEKGRIREGKRLVNLVDFHFHLKFKIPLRDKIGQLGICTRLYDSSMEQ